jgi:hypothetical protein
MQDGAKLAQSCVATQHKIGGTFFRFGHVLGHLGHAPLFGQCEVAAVFVKRAVEECKQVDLPAPLRPTKPTFSPGLMVTDAASSRTLALRRSVTFLS